MREKKLFFLIFTLLVVGMACSTLSGSNQTNTPPENQDTVSISPTQTATLSSPTNSPIPEGDEESGELPPLSFDRILQAGIEAGNWSEGEGIVQLLKYFVGEISADQIQDISKVEEQAGTGIVRLAGDYLESPDGDPKTQEELERLLRMIFPPQEVLDLISQKGGFVSSNKLASPSKPSLSQQDQAACQNLANQGYVGNVDPGVLCFFYEEKEIDGNILRVYYPEFWSGDEEKEALIGNTLDALADAVITYSGFDALTIKNVNLLFSILPDGSTNGEQYYFDIDNQACPITMFPRAAQSYNLEQYKQIVAHEMFHCVQDWSFTNTKPYSIQKWWLEGSAHYFSNLVYPNANREWASLPWFDQDSVTQSIFQMTYENFVFFQYMGNKYSPEVLIDILDRLSAYGEHDGQRAALAAVQGMEGNFNQFVVEYLSIGVLDSGGGRITTDPAKTTGTKPIKDKGEVQFTTGAFIATRYYADYEKEKRFLQSPIEEGNGSFSSVEYDLKKVINAWSSLPPEVRSKCKENIRYLFVVTTTNEGYYTHSANVNEAEKAECDPCLLGTWDVDPESYKAFMERIMAQADTGGMAINLGIGGHQYLQFVVDGKVYSQREDFSIRINDQLTTIINGSGSGSYSANGKEMTVSNFLDVTESVGLDVGDGQITYSTDGSQANFSIFGMDYSSPTIGPGLNEGNTPQTRSVEYVCEKDTLTITMPDFGDLLLNRVDKILPTPIPTPGTPDIPNP
jgi:hypothetical protein